MRQIRLGCQVSLEKKGIVMLLLDYCLVPQPTFQVRRGAQESIIQAGKLVPLGSVQLGDRQGKDVKTQKQHKKKHIFRDIQHIR